MQKLTIMITEKAISIDKNVFLSFLFSSFLIRICSFILYFLSKLLFSKAKFNSRLLYLHSALYAGNARVKAFLTIGLKVYILLIRGCNCYILARAAGRVKI